MKSEKNPKWTPKQRVETDCYASAHGITTAVSHYQGQYSQIKNVEAEGFMPETERRH